jgi:hypothetical protein
MSVVKVEYFGVALKVNLPAELSPTTFFDCASPLVKGGE